MRNKDRSRLGDHAFVTKLAGFEYSDFLQNKMTKEANEIPLIQGNNIKDGKIIYSFEWYITKKISDSLPRSSLNKKCIIIPYVGDIGELAIFNNDFKCHLASNVAKVELTDDKVDLEYLYYYLRSPYGQAQLLKYSQGSVQKNITMRAIRDTELLLPDIKTQKKISSILSTIDSKIEINTKIIDNLESQAKLLYSYWFIQFCFPNFQNKPYKINKGGMNYNSTFNRDIPNNWKVLKFKDILETIESGNRPIGGIKDISEGAPSIGAENILGIGKYLYKKEKLISWDYFNKMNKGIVKSGDVLMYKDGASLGRVSMFKNDFPYKVCSINSHAFILRSKKEISQNYLYFWLDQEYMKKKIIEIGMTSAQPGINQADVNNLPILVPSRDIIKSFEAIINPIVDSIFIKAKENKDLSDLKDWLLPMLVNQQITLH